MPDDAGVCPTCQAADPVCGVVVRGAYDGTLYWECLEDGTRWHRWPEGHYLRERAELAMRWPPGD